MLDSDLTSLLDGTLDFLGGRETSYGDVASLVNLVIGVISFIAFCISLATLAFGFIQMITSQGDPKNLEKARRTLFWSIAGMVLATAIFALKNVVIDLFGIGSVTFY